MFALAREERIASGAREDLVRRSTSRLEGRLRMVVPMGLLAAALYASFIGAIPPLVAPLVLAAYVGVMLWRKQKLTSLVERWEKTAGETSLRPAPARKLER